MRVNKNQEYLLPSTLSLKHVVFILFFCLLVLVPISLYTLSHSNKQKAPITNTPSVKNTEHSASPTSLPLSSQENNVNHDEKLFQKIQNRQPLSFSDTSAKNTILSLLPQGQQSGTVYQTDAFRVEYSASGDLFYVEILTQNISEAKGDANLWFRNQGMSQQGLCDLPLQFYLNYNVTQQLPDARSTFNPLPETC